VKLIRNTGADRVIDLLRPQLTPGRQLDVVTPALSLFAFSEIRREMDELVGCRLLLPSASAELALLGTDADRAARNRLQTRWLASRLSQWLGQGRGPARPWRHSRRARSSCAMASTAAASAFSARWRLAPTGSG
jgi:hypothetical protein